MKRLTNNLRGSRARTRRCFFWLWSILLVLWVIPCLAAEDEAFPLAYRRLRRDFLISASLPPAAQGFRQEHLQFLRSATTLIDGLSAEKEEEKPYLFTAIALRGMLLMHCGRLVPAREEFDAALHLFLAAEDGEEPPAIARGRLQLPVGAPNIPTVKLYRALTFAAESPERFVKEMEKLPETEVVIGSAILQDTMRAFAEALVARKRYDEAMVVYGMIKKYSLWDADKHQDPQRMMELLEIRKQHQGGM